MPFQLSPGVNVTEVDLTTIVPAVATSTGAIAGIFNWGPVGQRILIDTETKLVSQFGKPSSNNAETWFTAANFLNYGNSLYVVRAANTTSTDPTIGASSAVALNAPTATVPQIGIKNVADYTNQLNLGNFATNYANAYFIAKYVGQYGNSLRVSVCDSAAAYSSVIPANGSATATSNGWTGAPAANASFTMTIATGSNTANFTFSTVNGGSSVDANNFCANVVAAIAPNDYILVGNSTIGTQLMQVSSVANYSNGTVANAAIFFTTPYRLATNFVSSPTVNPSITRQWEFAGSVGPAPGVSPYQAANAPVTGTINSVSTTLNGNAITTSSSVTGLQVGYTVAGVGIPANTTVVSISVGSPSTIVLSNTATVTGTTNINYSGAVADQLHIVVQDENGVFTGVPGTIIESFANLSRSKDAKSAGGASTYYATVINQSSNYIWWANDRSGAASAVSTALTPSTNQLPYAFSLQGGTDGYSCSTASLSTITAGYDLFASAENVDVSLILQGKPIGGTPTTINGISNVGNYQLANYLIDNIAETRKDCIVLISPDDLVVRSNAGNEATAIITWRNQVHDSSYAVMDTGYKYQYDRYNDVYRYIPMNADVAGLCVRTDNTRDPWWSPAGFNRGQIKNIVQLRYNPTKADRDAMYPKGINPVVAFPGQGVVLFGDKTLQTKPSAFDHINVRRLFIVLEKAIATAAKFFLFEFNDAFTQAQFKALVNPYLRDIQGRRGITDFLVVCDATNNTPQVVDSNQFVGDIYIKPARSINYIQLNFVAVRTGVQFSEIVGQF